MPPAFESLHILRDSGDLTPRGSYFCVAVAAASKTFERAREVHRAGVADEGRGFGLRIKILNEVSSGWISLETAPLFAAYPNCFS